MKRTTRWTLLAASLWAGAPAAAQDVVWELPQTRWSAGVAGAGDRVWVAAAGEGLIELAPGQTPRRISGPGSAVALAASAGGRVVVADYDRTLHRIEDGRWTRGPTPPEGGFADAIEALAIDASGTTYALARTGGLHTWDGRGRRVRTVPLPGEGRAEHLAVAGSRIFITGEHRRLQEVRRGRVLTPAFAPAVLGALERDYQELGALWVSPQTGHLFIGTSAARVLEVDLATDRVTVHDVGLFGQIRAITGAVIDGAEVVILAGQSELATLTGDRVEALPGDHVFARGLYVHAASLTLFVSCQDSVHAIALRERRLLDAPPVAVAAAPVEAVAPTPPERGSTRSASSEPRVEDMNMEGQCDLFGALALTATVIARGGQCVSAGDSVSVTLAMRGNRVREVEAEAGAPGACVRRRLRGAPAPGMSACRATFRLVR